MSKSLLVYTVLGQKQKPDQYPTLCSRALTGLNRRPWLDEKAFSKVIYCTGAHHSVADNALQGTIYVSWIKGENAVRREGVGRFTGLPL
jgi:hypothetical protein